MVAKSNSETVRSNEAVTPLQPIGNLLDTELRTAYLLSVAPIQTIRVIIPQKTGVNSSSCLSLLISLYFKPSTVWGLTSAFNTQHYSVVNRVEYLKELGYLKEDVYRWRHAVGYGSAVRYSVNSKGRAALRRLLGMLNVSTVSAE